MSLYCAADGHDDYSSGDWWWYDIQPDAPLATKRSRKCCSCKARIAVGDTSRKVFRAREPVSEIEERIHGEEVPLSDLYLCETCGDLAESLRELGFCFTLGGASLKTQILDYRANS